MSLHHFIFQNLQKIRQQRPLILNITNFVAMDFSANALLALGASPIMSLDVNEMDELVESASAVVINMGTLSDEWIKVAKRAWSLANQRSRPVIFDPVGAGATTYRTKIARYFLENYQTDIIRGNASELLALFSGKRSGKGVDSTADLQITLNSLRNAHSTSTLATNTTVVMSGATDYVVSANQVHSIKNGAPEMTTITAMGCVATCLIAAFRSVENDAHLAAVHGMAISGICGEIAAETTSGPGSLRSKFIDLLADINLPIESRIKVSVE